MGWDRLPVLRGLPTATFLCLRTMPTLPTLLPLRSCTPVPVPTDPWDRLPVLRGMPTATFPCLRTTPTLPTLHPLRSCTPVLVPTDLLHHAEADRYAPYGQRVQDGDAYFRPGLIINGIRVVISAACLLGLC